MKFKNCFIVVMIVLLVISPINATNIEYRQNFTINEGDEFRLNVDAYDPDSDILSYYFSPPLDNNGSWTPEYDAEGIYIVEITVSDGEYSDTQNVTIIVKNTDRAPIIIATGKRWVYEGEEIAIKLEAFDPDGDEIYFEVLNAPEDSYLFNNTIYWTPDYKTVEKSWIVKILNFYHIDFIKDTKEVNVMIKAVSNELSNNATIPLEVINVNLPPVIDEMNDIFIKETDKLYLNPSAYDPDGDYLRYFYFGWANKNTKKTDYGDAGNYTVVVMASDGLLSSSIDVNVIVEKKNRAPIMPKFKDIKIYENQTLIIELDAYDPDGDELIFSLTNPEEIPEGSELINKTFTWKPGFEFIETEEIEKIVKINFTVWDGEYSDTQEAKITVKNKNRAPYIYNYFPEYDAYELYVDQYMIFSINATDLDGDNITYKWNFGIIDRDINSNSIKRIFRRPGIKKVTAVASDGVNEVRKTWLIRVKGPIVIQEEKPEQETSKPGEFYHFEVQHPEEPEPEKPWYYEFWVY